MALRRRRARRGCYCSGPSARKCRLAIITNYTAERQGHHWWRGQVQRWHSDIRSCRSSKNSWSGHLFQIMPSSSSWSCLFCYGLSIWIHGNSGHRSRTSRAFFVYPSLVCGMVRRSCELLTARTLVQGRRDRGMSHPTSFLFLRAFYSTPDPLKICVACSDSESCTTSWIALDRHRMKYCWNFGRHLCLIVGGRTRLHFYSEARCGHRNVNNKPNCPSNNKLESKILYYKTLRLFPLMKLQTMMSSVNYIISSYWII